MNQKRRRDYRLISRVATERLEFLLILALAVVTIGLGFIGFCSHLNPEDYSWLTMFHKSIQLLLIEGGDFREPVNRYLIIARSTGVLVFGYAIIKSLFLIFLTPDRATKNQVLIKRLNRHHVVCGLGTLGGSIANAWAASGKQVLVLDRELADDDFENLVDRGIAVVRGEAADVLNLVAAGIDTAAVCVVCCGGDGANAAVTMAVMARRMNPKSGEAMELLTHIRDQNVFTLLQNHEKTLGAMDRIDLRKFDMVSSASKHQLRDYPLDHRPIDPNGQFFVQVIFAGWSTLSEGILKAVAAQCHMPNKIKVRAVLAFANATEVHQNILFRYPQIGNILDITEVPFPPDSTGGAARIRELACDAEAVTTIFLSMGDDDMTLKTAMGLHSVLFGLDLPLFLVSSRRDRLRLLFEGRNEKPRLGVFGISDPASELANQADPTQEMIAQALHQIYLDGQTKNREKNPGENTPIGPAEVPWARLPEEYRTDNRNNAGHWEYKLRTIGRELVSEKDNDPRPTADLTDAEIEILSMLEHQRWNANKWLQGWKWGPARDNNQRLHQDLIPYTELSEETKEKDRQTIRALIQLDRQGFRIVRMAPKVV